MVPEKGNVTPVFKSTRRIQGINYKPVRLPWITTHRLDAQLAAKIQLRQGFWKALPQIQVVKALLHTILFKKPAVTHMPVRKLGVFIKADQSFFCWAACWAACLALLACIFFSPFLLCFFANLMFLRNLGSTYKNKGKISHIAEETHIKTLIAPYCSNYSQMQAVSSSDFFSDFSTKIF